MHPNTHSHSSIGAEPVVQPYGPPLMERAGQRLHDLNDLDYFSVMGARDRASLECSQWIVCTARLAPEEAVFRPALPLHLQPEFTGERPMAKAPYSEQLKHPFWQRKRLEVLDAAGFACQSCGAKDKTLHVHHKHYVKGRQVWEYEQEELEALCEDCHEEAHRAKALIDKTLAQTPSIVWPRVADMLVGYLTDYVDSALWLDIGGTHWARHGEVANYLNNLGDGDAFELRDLILSYPPDMLLELMRREVGERQQGIADRREGDA